MKPEELASLIEHLEDLTDCAGGAREDHETAILTVGRINTILSSLRRVAEMEDRVDGLNADLFNAVETAHGRGATEWARLNYPKWIERIEANAAARQALTGEA